MDNDLAEPRIPELEPRAHDDERERRGGGLPWLPNLAVAKGKGVAAHLLLILASKLGLIAAIGTLAAASAGVGVAIRHDSTPSGGPADPRAVAGRMRQDAAGARGVGGPGLVSGGADGAMDGMAYVKGGLGADPAAQAAANAAAAGGDAAAQGAAAAANGQAAAGSGSAGQTDWASAVAAAGQNGGSGSASPKTILAKLPSFGNSGFMGGAFGGAGVGGRGNAGRDGSDPALRDARVGSAPRERLVGLGRTTVGARNSKALGDLRALGPNQRLASGHGLETASAAGRTGFDTAGAPAGQAITGAGAGTPSPAIAAQPAAAPGSVPGEGGPISGPSGFASPKPPDIPDYKDVTPYNWLIISARALMAMALVLAIVLGAAEKFSFLSAGLIGTLTYVLAGIGAMLTVMGSILLGLGQFRQGMIWTTVGGAIVVGALAFGSGAKFMWLGLASAIAAPIGGLLNEVLMQAHGEGVFDKEKAKDAYRRKYGIDPDTHEVIDAARQRFDDRYGPGASRQWDIDHGDMTKPLKPSDKA